MSQFVVGQWVECVNSNKQCEQIVEKGKFYRVKSIEDMDVRLEGIKFARRSDRFRPVSWQVGRTYRTTLEGVTATIVGVGSDFIHGRISDESPPPIRCWVSNGTGLLAGFDLTEHVPHLTPYLAEPSPALETTEASKATLCDSAKEIRELLLKMDALWKKAKTTSHPERLQHDEKCPFVPSSCYHRTINGATLDLYDLADAYGIKSHRIFHAVKKLILAGRRGHKDREQDLREAIVSIESELQKMKGGA